MSVVIADPPWTHLQEHRAHGTTTRLRSNDYFEERDLDADLLREFHRVLKPGGYLAVYLPPYQRASHLIWVGVLRAAVDVGLVPVRQITLKKARGTGYRWTGTTEPIFCFAKPLPDGSLPRCADKQATNFLDVDFPRGKARTPYTDVTRQDRDEWDALLKQYGGANGIPLEVRRRLKGRFHDTEKPVEAARHVLRVARDPGGLLMDCFAGTGHACIAAHDAGMHYVAVERNPARSSTCWRRDLWPRCDASSGSTAAGLPPTLRRAPLPEPTTHPPSIRPTREPGPARFLAGAPSSDV